MKATERIIFAFIALLVAGSLIAATPIKSIVFQGDADAGGNQIANLGSPTNSSNAATAEYVTNQIALVATNYTPAIRFTDSPSTNSAGIPGSMIKNGNYLYLCTGTNSWARIELLTW